MARLPSRGTCLYRASLPPSLSSFIVAVLSISVANVVPWLEAGIVSQVDKTIEDLKSTPRKDSVNESI